MNNGEEGSETTSSSLSTSASSTNVSATMNGDAESHEKPEKTPTNNKVPWVEELKLNQAKKSMQGELFENFLRNSYDPSP